MKKQMLLILQVFGDAYGNDSGLFTHEIGGEYCSDVCAQIDRLRGAISVTDTVKTTVKSCHHIAPDSGSYG